MLPWVDEGVSHFITDEIWATPRFGICFCYHYTLPCCLTHRDQSWYRSVNNFLICKTAPVTDKSATQD